MHKVTMVNLNGQAYQLEEAGYEQLQKYLHKAEQALADDPDKAEVVADLEQAIADKCQRLLRDGKNVVTQEQIAEILTRMGAVENDAVTGQNEPNQKPAKRLYTIREGGVFAGVCKGIAAYLNVEPNIVRVLFVVFTVLTHGFGLLVYVALALFLPHAKTDIELAEAYGKPVSAQDIADRVRERAADPETIQNISDGMVKLFRIIMKIVAVSLAVLFGIGTFAWLWTLWQQMLGRLDMHGSLQVLNGWRVALVVTLLYLLVSLPVFLLYRVFDRFADQRAHTKIGTVSETTLAVVWGAALTGLLMFASTYSGRVYEYVRTHGGKLDVGNSSVCVDSGRCDGSELPRRLYYQY